MTPLALALLVLALLAVADVTGSRVVRAVKHNKTSRKVELPAGCLYGGRWHGEGAVRTREACLECACARGALSCRRRTCAPLPAPPPGCRQEHAPGACCSELHCPDGVIKLDQNASARLDDSLLDSTVHAGVVLPACVEGGTVYAAGSAMSSGVPCEQCFCLGGARRCVRPRCLPPPPGCRAPPAPGACCPQRYYCQHVDTTPPHEQNPHDCQTENGQWVREGERLPALNAEEKCTQCFCLAGKILCQGLSCAPQLRGCTPLVLPGQCCPHKYICSDRSNNTMASNLIRQDNLLVPLNENRSFHTSKSAKRETTVKVASSHASKKPSPATTTKLTTTVKPTATTKPPTTTNATTIIKITTVTKPTITIKKNLTTKAENYTTSYKMHYLTSSSTIGNDKNSTTTTPVPTIKREVTTKSLITVTEENTITDTSTESTSTEQPERSIKIIINGTVNCSTELSSSTLLLNTTNTNDSVWINTEIHPRIPFFNREEIEAQTSIPHEIITNRVYNEDFDENESFTINVTSSLRTNTSSPVLSTMTTTTTSTSPRPKTVPPMLVDGSNASKPKKDELDFDYNEPTLPPSLPNLKIIPFVAADAVVDNETPPKDTAPFTSVEQDEKFPVYYPGLETKEHEYPIRREDDYNANQYPIFVSEKDDKKSYPSLNNFDQFGPNNENITDTNLPGIQKFISDTTLSNNVDMKPPEPSISNSRISGSNRFSPPAETEGGFIPKGPGAIDDFFSIYPSTPPGPAVPHLTTSMQIDTNEECTSSTGQRIAEGESIEMGCSLCICAWSELHCSPRPCHTPPGCRWRSASIHSHDLCCGELICDHDSKITPVESNKNIEEPSNDPIKYATNVQAKEEVNLISSNGTATVPIKDVQNKFTINDDSQVNKTRAEVTTQQTQLSTAKVEEHINKSTTVSEEPASNSSQSLEYEEEDDDDEGFSLGSVLKLLLSENYDTKTSAITLPPTKKTTVRVLEHTVRSTTPRIETTTKDFFDTPSEFIPMPPSIVPFKKIPVSNAITRIDHLLLGESNAIRDSSSRPPATKPPPTTRHILRTKPSTSHTTTRKEVVTEPTHTQILDVQPPQLAVGLGLLKLAGCNIYGQIYSVGRVITELSTSCQECRCTEFGVHCTALDC